MKSLWKRIIDYLPSEKVSSTAFVVLCIAMVAILGALITEYRFFRNQSEKMLELKSEYGTYVVALKKIIDDYNKVRERLELVEGSLDPQKKKELDRIAKGLAKFPAGAVIISSAETDRSRHVTITRDVAYLKDEARNCFKDAGMQSLWTHIDAELCDYTDLMIAQNTPPKKKVAATARKKVTTSHKRGSQNAIFSWPISRKKFWLSSLYGPRKNGRAWGFHHGIDMAALRGTPVKAAGDGVVIKAGWVNGFGNMILIQHDKTYTTRYAHLDSMAVVAGQRVTRGTFIGRVGDTGRVRKSGRDASHLHFEVIASGKRINPLYALM